MKKRIGIFATLCLLAGLAVVPAHARAVEFQAKVPFSFVVLGKTFPAGEYILSPAPHMINIEDSNGTLLATALANEVAGRSAGSTSQIIFHCYGGRCFLSELRSLIPGNGRQLLISRREVELAKKQQGQYFAVLGEKPRQ